MQQYFYFLTATQLYVLSIFKFHPTLRYTRIQHQTKTSNGLTYLQFFLNNLIRVTTYSLGPYNMLRNYSSLVTSSVNDASHLEVSISTVMR